MPLEPVGSDEVDALVNRAAHIVRGSSKLVDASSSYLKLTEPNARMLAEVQFLWLWGTYSLGLVTQGLAILDHLGDQGMAFRESMRKMILASELFAPDTN